MILFQVKARDSQIAAILFSNSNNNILNFFKLNAMYAIFIQYFI